MSDDMNKKTRRNITPFNGEKYGIWKMRIRALIEEEGALQALDENPPHILTSRWRKKERLAKGVIIEHLSDAMLGFATSTDTARSILLKLDSLYERQSLATQLAVEKKLIVFKYKDDSPLTKHFILFDEMIVELAAAGETLKETSKIARLLLTLPTTYDPVVTAIQTMADNKMTLPFVKTRLLDYEIKLRNERNDTSGKVLNTEVQQQRKSQYHNYGNTKKPNNNRPNFKHKPHYNKFTRKSNFQSTHDQRNKIFKRNNSNSFNKRCDFCGRRNHDKRDCYYYKKTLQTSENRQRTIQTVHVQNNEDGFAFMNGVEVSSRINNTTNKLTFILDSGATDHLVNTVDAFSIVRDLPEPVKITIAKKNAMIMATKRGSIDVTTDLGESGVLENVLYAPEVPYNLLSVQRIQQAGMRVIFSENGKTSIQKGDKIIATGKSFHNLVCVDFIIQKKMCNNAKTIANLNTYKLWHERLGHMGKSKFIEFKRNNLILNSKKLERINPTNEICEACVYAKQARLSFSKERDRSHVTRPLFIIHSDVCGPITPTTIDGNRYFVTFIDEFTHYTVVYLLRHKSDVFKMFKDFLAKSEAHFNLKLAHLNCDNGREYLSNEFKSFCADRGIQYHLTVPYTPQQNPIAERMNKSLTEKARAMIHGAELNKELWGEAILTAAYLLNLSPTKALRINKTPYEMWHNKKAKLDHLKIFGSTVYVHDKIQKSKFDKRSMKGILVGYAVNGYKILNTETNKFAIARDVIFDEINFKTSRPLVKIEGIELKDSNVESQNNETDLNSSVVKRQKLENYQMSETHKNEESKINKSNIQTDGVDNTSFKDEINSQESSNHNELR